LETYDIGQFGRIVDKVEHGHARYRDDRKIRDAFAHLHDDFETVGSLQENIDDRQLEFGSFELLQRCRGACRFNHLKMIDPQRDGDHRAYIRLIVDHENAGQRTAHGMASVSLIVKPGVWGKPLEIIPHRRKNAVTPSAVLALG